MSNPSPIAPKPAAAIILVRDGHEGIEVLMLQKSNKVSFAAGALVFPGGRVDEEDYPLGQAIENSPLSPFKIAATRELYEECGISLKTHMSNLIHFAHWITPEDSPKRFDTHFFLAAFNDKEQNLVVDKIEITHAQWRRPQDVIDESKVSESKLVLPTLMNLTKLARLNLTTDIFQFADKPVVTVMPCKVETPDGAFMQIPKDAGYGTSMIPLTDIQRAYKTSPSKS